MLRFNNYRCGEKKSAKIADNHGNEYCTPFNRKRNDLYFLVCSNRNSIKYYKKLNLFFFQKIIYFRILITDVSIHLYSAI